MVEFIWHNEDVPMNMTTRQVYGIIFTQDGRMMLKIENTEKGKIYSLAGGTPENYDADRIATLKRELIEEINTEIEDKVVLVGYQTVLGDENKPAYAQVRMTAMIKHIGEKMPDVDNGKIYDRLLTSPQNAIKLLNWTSGDIMINHACEIAKQEFGLEFNCLEDEWL